MEEDAEQIAICALGSLHVSGRLTVVAAATTTSTRIKCARVAACVWSPHSSSCCYYY